MSPSAKQGRNRGAAERGADGAARRPCQAEFADALPADQANQIAQFVLDLSGVGNRMRDFPVNQLAVALAQTMHSHRYGSGGHPQPLRSARITAIASVG